MRVQVQRIRGRGRGVIAARDFRAGEIVEVSPVIRLRDWEVRGVLAHYVYNFGRGSALALGAGSLFNHSSRPNMWIQRNVRRMQIAYIARRIIQRGEELTVDYGYRPRGYDGK